MLLCLVIFRTVLLNILSPDKFVVVTCGCKEENGEVKVVPREGSVPFVLRGLKGVP